MSEATGPYDLSKKGVCRGCTSTSVELHKSMYRDGTFHIYLTCEECFARYLVPRDSTAYEKTKDKLWLTGDNIKQQAKLYSKKRKKLKKGQLSLL